MLTPAKIAIEALSASKIDLIRAEVILDFLLDEVKSVDGYYAQEFYKILVQKLEKRRNHNLFNLASYLNNPSTYADREHFKIPSKASIQKFGAVLILRLFDQEQQENSNDTSDKSSEPCCSKDCNETKEQTLYEKLYQSIGSSKNDSQTKPPEATTFDKIQQEFKHFEKFHQRTSSLEKLFQALMTVQPTSTQSERNFSMSNGVICKIRTGLGDQEIDNLCFLKSYFLSL